MRLSEFIVAHREQILSDWVAFARTCLPPADAVDYKLLRDHAAEMLGAIAADLKTSQSELERVDKSKGKSDAEHQGPAPDTAAQSHGAGRAESGFSIEQMVSEYRALRATVIRLWIKARGPLALEDIEDVVRFNEAIDQSLAESTSSYAQELAQSKEMFLGMLGHDLRAPLGAILGSARIIVENTEHPERCLKMASLILSSGQRMNALVDDLLDFTRSRLGSGIPVVPTPLNMATLCHHTVEEIATQHPDRVMNFKAMGELDGEWDGARVSQALSNVIGNAVEHGSDASPINVVLRGEAEEVKLTVQNQGPVIPADQITRIFQPMHSIEMNGPVTPRPNLGLGLYIAERIVAAHGGTIAVESSEELGTAFTIHLPKRREVNGKEPSF